MPITPFWDGFRFDPETRRAMGVAFEMTRTAIRLDGLDPIDKVIAEKIIELAKAGVSDPDQLCELALDELRKPAPRL
jgi:hypothetical protein